mmetsp:Transcript_2457/g.2892  ORF Transcript_2457/g.2892 Transcript_2457/m.2892 type:complete len:138 (+) Transcript_2457:291-704(+)
MENNRYTQEEFNSLFFSAISMGYLFLNLLLIGVGLFISKYILEANPTHVEKPQSIELEEAENEPDDLFEEATENESGYDSSTTIEPKVHIRKSKDLEEYKEIKITRKDKIHPKDPLLDMFQNERWRIIPLLLYPYTA